MKYTLSNAHSKTGLIKKINKKNYYYKENISKLFLTIYRCSICAPRVTRQTSVL